MSNKAIVISNQTRQKVEAAKIFIEQRYSRLIHQQKQKRQYWQQLNQKMKDMHMNETQKESIKNKILHIEAEKLRNDRTKLSIQDFQSIKIVGKGAFGEVRLCKWKKNGEPVAVKKLKKSEMIYKNKVIQVRQQRNVLANSDKNPWIVGLKCSFQDADNLYLVMDYVPGGDLMNLLIKKDIFTHQQAKFYIAEMILAINCVHELKYIHRDIKPDNILIDQRGHIKLSDFGLCKHTEMRAKKVLESLRKNTNSKQHTTQITRIKFEQNQKQLKHKRRKLAYSAVGTPDYVAPQVQGKNGYTQTVDWWSLGVIFYEMLVGYPPFASEESSITWQKIQNWRKFLVIPRDANVSLQAADLIRKLINDADDRLGVNGVEEIMAHPFFAGVNWKNLREKKAPNIPTLKTPFDTCNFDPFQQEQPWIPLDNKQKYRSKKGTEFIGYTFKPAEQENSQLLKALLDLDNYRQPQQLHRNSIESLYLQTSNLLTNNQLSNTNRLFKKERSNGKKKEFYATTTTTLVSPKYSTANKLANNIQTSNNAINNLGNTTNTSPNYNSPTIPSTNTINNNNKNTINNNNLINNNSISFDNRGKMPSPPIRKVQKKPQSPNIREKQQKRPISGLNFGTKVKVIPKKPLEFKK